LEDRPLLTGRGRSAADISFAQQLHMRVVRSNVAHGQIRSLDVTAALTKPGVRAVWTAADVVDIPPIDFRLRRIEGLEPYRQRLFVTGLVRYVGEPVAAVFAEDAYLAEDAAELVVLDVEELPVLCTLAKSPASSNLAGRHLTQLQIGHSRDANPWRKIRHV
jgi:carbon-monoxide dehydrogenase large subunit